MRGSWGCWVPFVRARVSFPLAPGPHFGTPGYLGPHTSLRCIPQFLRGWSLPLSVCHNSGLSLALKLRCQPFPGMGARGRGRAREREPGVCSRVLGLSSSLRKNLGIQRCWGGGQGIWGELVGGKEKFKYTLVFNPITHHSLLIIYC